MDAPAPTTTLDPGISGQSARPVAGIDNGFLAGYRVRFDEAGPDGRLRTSALPTEGGRGPGEVDIDNLYFTQAISNPVDLMTSIAFLLAGGVCERFPGLKLVCLEANGGWIVPWLERLDHHAEVFSWDVPWLKQKPSEYFKRQCWISFDPDESTLAFSANSPLCGADRIIWASDYPHPDAKFPGIAGANAVELYGLPG